MKTKIALVLSTAILIGCSSVSDSIPTVKIEKRKQKASVMAASYMMKANNDAVRVMVVEDGDTGSRVLSEVEVDCRDYFLRKSLTPTEPKIIRAAAPKRRAAALD